MRTIRLYDHLATDFGREFKLDVKTPAEAVRALCRLLPGFKRRLVTRSAPGYHVKVGPEYKGEAHLADPCGEREIIRISPALAGASGGKGQVILGVVLVVIGLMTENYDLVYMGAAMIVGGVAQMLSPQPKLVDDDGNLAKADIRSYNFDGPINVQGQGYPVAVGYGKLMTGSAVVSGRIFTEYIIPVPLSETYAYLHYTYEALDHPPGGVALDQVPIKVIGHGEKEHSGTLEIDVVSVPPVTLPVSASTVYEDGILTAAGDARPAGHTFDLQYVSSDVSKRVASEAFSVQGNYGILHVGPDSAYTYTLNTKYLAVQRLQDGEMLSDVFTFSYGYVTPQGPEGELGSFISTFEAPLTITIVGRSESVAGPDIVDSNATAPGHITHVAASGIPTAGGMHLRAPTGIHSLMVGPTTMLTLAQLKALGTTPVPITTQYGVLTLTSLEWRVPSDDYFSSVQDDGSNDTVYDPGGETNGSNGVSTDPGNTSFGNTTNDTDDEGSDDESEG